MLHIHFQNDGTGKGDIGNYKWVVMINKEVLDKGILKGHKRSTGWQGLLKDFVKALTREEKKNV